MSVDIYNTALPALAAPRVTGGERATAAFTTLWRQADTTKPRPAEQRQKEAEAWWYHDGRGQQHLRDWLESVAEDHRKKKAGHDYQSMKKSMERQANFRDDRSDSSNTTNVPEAANSGEAADLLLGSVLAKPALTAFSLMSLEDVRSTSSKPTGRCRN